jgi:methionyl-tRNA synthetase
MIAKNFGGQMPPRQDGSGDDNKIVSEAITAIARMEEAMVTEQLHEAAAELITALSAANLYFAEQAPWGKKDDMARMGAILATTADVLRRTAIAAQPFVPTAASKMLDLLAVPADQRLLQHALDPDSGITPETVLPPPEPVFKKFEQAKPAT